MRALAPVVVITLPPAGSNPGDFVLEGFAFDPGAAPPGIDGIHVWVYPNLGSGAAVFQGLAPYGSASNEPELTTARRTTTRGSF